MSKRFAKQPWKVRKARRVHSYPELLNGHGDVIAAVYGGDDCAAYLVDLPKFHACLKATVKAFGSASAVRNGKRSDAAQAALDTARELLAVHA